MAAIAYGLLADNRNSAWLLQVRRFPLGHVR